MRSGDVIARRQAVQGLRTPMLEMIRRRPGVTHRQALEQLAEEGRVAVFWCGRLGDGLRACRALAADGLIEGGEYRGWRCL